MWLAALKGLAAIPQIVEQLQNIGKKLDEKQALERLDSKRDRNRAAIQRVLDAEAGQRGEADSSPAIQEGGDSST
tara:strand:+ start:482 stop:706 length:225 start_codon:yes stop_codon:yes gene_type:complete